MFPLPLSEEDQRLFERALRNPHQMRILVSILNRNEELISEFNCSSDNINVLSGDVQVDALADRATRSLSITILDQDGKVDGFLPDAPGDLGATMDNFVRVERGIYVDALEDWVDVPIFTGPIGKVQAKDKEVTIQALGKESLARAPHFFYKNAQAVSGGSLSRGTTVTSAIRAIMGAVGEEKFLFEDPSDRKLNKTLSVSGRQEPWKVAKKLAAQINRQLFYDGAGNLRLRRFPHTPFYAFKDGIEGDVLVPAEVTYDIDSFRNVISVRGPRPEGKNDKRRPFATRRVPTGNKLSPESLARNGQPRYITEFVDITEVKTRDRDCEAMADRLYQEMSRGNIEVNFESLVVPHIEELDNLRIDTEDIQMEWKTKKFSIGLSNTAAMAHGFARPLDLTTKGGRVSRHVGVHSG